MKRRRSSDQEEIEEESSLGMSIDQEEERAELKAAVKEELGTRRLRFLKRSGTGGCISEGFKCLTDTARVFIKVNREDGARIMFDGEVASLTSIAAAGVVRVPKPIKVVNIPNGGAAIVMEYLDIVGNLDSEAAILGAQMARLHLHNSELLAKQEAQSQSVHKDTTTAPDPVSKFGFHVPTYCGYIPQDNEWRPTWEEFYASRIQSQIELIQKEFGDRGVGDQWSHLQRRLPHLLGGVSITPALLHGDLWTGNAGQLRDSPVVFDPSSFYGHSEFDLAIASMFGGYPKTFFDAYFEVIPKAEGFDKRHELYKLFNHLNHWNHFGGAYRQSSMSILTNLNRDSV